MAHAPMIGSPPAQELAFGVIGIPPQGVRQAHQRALVHVPGLDTCQLVVHGMPHGALSRPKHLVPELVVAPLPQVSPVRGEGGVERAQHWYAPIAPPLDMPTRDERVKEEW